MKDRRQRAEKIAENQREKGAKTQLLIKEAIEELKKEKEVKAITRTDIRNRVNQLAAKRNEKGCSLATIGRSKHVEELFDAALATLARAIADEYRSINVNDLRAINDPVRVARRLLKLPPEVLVSKLMATQEALVLTRINFDETTFLNIQLLEKNLPREVESPQKARKKAR